MLSRKLASQAEIQKKLQEFSHWKQTDNSISRSYEFADFKEAFAFLRKVADLSEELNHHAEIWNVYNKVKLTLSTHDTIPAGGGITEYDFEFIRRSELFL